MDSDLAFSLSCIYRYPSLGYVVFDIGENAVLKYNIYETDDVYGTPKSMTISSIQGIDKIKRFIQTLEMNRRIIGQHTKGFVGPCQPPPTQVVLKIRAMEKRWSERKDKLKSVRSMYETYFSTI
jgi:hypothetical protein